MLFPLCWRSREHPGLDSERPGPSLASGPSKPPSRLTKRLFCVFTSIFDIFRIDFGTILDSCLEVQKPKSLKAHWKTTDFAILHFSTPDPKNRLSGPVWDPQTPPESLPKRLPGRPSGPKMASKPPLGLPRWPSRRAPSTPQRVPDRPRSNFGGSGTLQALILAVRDPFCLQFGGPKRHFGRPGTHFPTPKHPFSNPKLRP